jgi:outer membrane protein assembly factor BamB/pSer/pThr/pTyr-binding forkhead associated (FHA) protein
MSEEEKDHSDSGSPDLDLPPLKDTFSSLLSQEDHTEGLHEAAVLPALVMLEGHDAGVRYELRADDAMTIGRESDRNPDIPLRHPDDTEQRRYSRNHAVVDFDGRTAELTSLYKRPEGVVVNGLPLRPGGKHRLQHGDKIRIFDILFQYEQSTPEENTVYGRKQPVILEVTQGADKGEKYHLLEGDYIFGREKQNNDPDIPLRSQDTQSRRRLSGRHAELRLHNGHAILLSHYREPAGVRVNDKDLPSGSELPLSSGDRIQMLSIGFQLHIGESEGQIDEQRQEAEKREAEQREAAAVPQPTPAVPGAAPQYPPKLRYAAAWRLCFLFALIALISLLGALFYREFFRQPLTLFISQGWTVRTGSTISASPSVAHVNTDGNLDLIVGDHDGRLHALDTKNSGSIWAGPWQGNGAVYGGSVTGDTNGDGITDVVTAFSDGSIVCIDGRTGEPRWQQQPGTGFLAGPALGCLNNDAHCDVVAGTAEGRIVALEGVNGGLMWEYRLSGAVIAAPSIRDMDNSGSREVFCGSRNGQVYVLDGETGDKLRSFDARRAIVSTPAIADLDNDGVCDFVFTAENDVVYAINGRTGVEMSRHTASTAVSGLTTSLMPFRYGSPVLGHLNRDSIPDVLLGTADNAVIALDGAGLPRKLWQFPTEAPVRSTPALADMNCDDTLDCVVGCDDGTIYILDGRNGKRLAGLNVGAPVISSPAIADLNGNGTLDIALTVTDGRILTIATNTPCKPWEIRWAGYMGSPAHTGYLEMQRLSWRSLYWIGIAAAFLLMLLSGFVLTAAREK